MLFQRVFSVIRNFRITASTYGGYFNTTKIFSLGMAIFCLWTFLQIYGQTENTNPKRNILQTRLDYHEIVLLSCGTKCEQTSLYFPL